MSKLFLRALRIAAIAVIGGLVVVEGQRTAWPPKLYALVLVTIVVAFLATTLPCVLQDLMAGRFPRKLAFSEENQPEHLGLAPLAVRRLSCEDSRPNGRIMSCGSALDKTRRSAA